MHFNVYSSQPFSPLIHIYSPHCTWNKMELNAWNVARISNGKKISLFLSLPSYFSLFLPHFNLPNCLPSWKFLGLLVLLNIGCCLMDVGCSLPLHFHIQIVTNPPKFFVQNGNIVNIDIIACIYRSTVKCTNWCSMKQIGGYKVVNFLPINSQFFTY